MRYWLQTRSGLFWVWLGNLGASARVIQERDQSRRVEWL